MGCAFLAGGMNFAVQTFNQSGASIQCSLLAKAVLVMGLPTTYTFVLPQPAEYAHMVTVSRWTSVLLLSLYGAFLVFQLRTHSDLFQDESEEGDEEEESENDLETVEGVMKEYDADNDGKVSLKELWLDQLWVSG